MKMFFFALHSGVGDSRSVGNASVASDHLEHDLSTKHHSQSSDEKMFCGVHGHQYKCLSFCQAHENKAKFMQPFACYLKIYPSRIPWIKDAVGQ